MVIWCIPWLVLVGSRPPPVPVQWRCGQLLANFQGNLPTSSTRNGTQGREIDVQPFYCIKELGAAI